MSYPVIKEYSQRHFLNSLYPDGGSWLIDSVGLVCLVALSLIGWLYARGSGSHQTCDPNTVTGAQWHNKFDFWLDIHTWQCACFLSTTFIHAHCQGRDHRNPGVQKMSLRG